MESKHKNALIGALLAVVFVMAVGYAAFAQQLTINGAAEITSTWDVHFDTGTETVTPQVGLTGAQAPDGRVEYLYDNQVANIYAELRQPGDTVTFVLHPKNFGTLDAKGTMAVNPYGQGGANDRGATQATTVTGATYTGTTCSGSGSSYTCTKDYIEFTVTSNLATPKLTPNSSDDITVVARYKDVATNATDAVPNAAGITIGLNYVQA